MSRWLIRKNDLALGMLVAAGMLHPAQSAVMDDGRQRLHALLNETLPYIQNQGGPHTDPDDVMRQLRWTVFYQVDHPYCPHCPPRAPNTAEQDAAMFGEVQAEAEQGRPFAQVQLAARYLEGEGVARDIPAGLRWLQIAAGNGAREAAYAFAQMHDRGIVLPVDHQAAAHWYEVEIRAAGKKAFSRVRLGELNEFGIGIPRDDATAMALYREELASSEQSRPLRPSERAQFALGRMFAEGKGVAQDYAEAARWFLEATNQGAGYGGSVPEAECALAIMYGTGLGVPQNRERSDFFLRRPNAMNMGACRSLHAERTTGAPSTS